MYRRPVIALLLIAAFMGAAAIAASIYLDQPLVDPEGFLGPAWMRLPIMVGAAFLADLLPRTLWRARFKARAMPEIARQRIREHWTKDRAILTTVGVVSFYVTYVCYRNIKSFMPQFLGDDAEDKLDRELHLVDRALFFGHEPAKIIHAIFGENRITAEFLSTVYLAYLPMVAISVAIWVVWSKNLRMGYWFVLATCLTWAIGTFSYYALQTLGPGFQYPWLYSGLPETGASDLMTGLDWGRQGMLRRGVQDAVQSVGGFPSLHTAITLLWALMIKYTVRRRIFHWIAWINFGLTVVATLYFGWHYIADDLGGATIALFSFYVGARLAGFTFDRRRTDRPVAIPSRDWPDGDPMCVEPKPVAEPAPARA